MARANPCSFLYCKIWTNISSNSVKPLFPEGIVVWKTKKEIFLPVSLSCLSFLVHNGTQQVVGMAQFMFDKKIFLRSKSCLYQRISERFWVNFSIPGHLRTFAPKNFPQTDFFKTLTDGRK